MQSVRDNEVNSDNIETTRLYLRRITHNDIESLYKIVKQNEVGMWLARGEGMSREETENYVENIVSHWNLYGFGVWAVIHKETDKLIGHCGLRYIDDTEDVEILYLINQQYWGNGYATEAANAAIGFAFKCLRIEKLFARVRTRNERSMKVLGKIGFTFLKNKDYNGRILSYFELNSTRWL
ncbi:GNAT family N-acetyltransferase [Cytobacillus sp. Hm23]